MRYPTDHSLAVTSFVRLVTLQSVFSEIDFTSEILEIMVSTGKPYLRFSTYGLTGSTHIDFSRDSDLIESFCCELGAPEEDSQPGARRMRCRYRLALMKPVCKPLALATRVSLRIEARGFLSMQFMVPADDAKVSFIEFFCVPDVEENEEEALLVD